ncbi:MAG: zf-HC2 domain-containing protein [Deltaproteobacteria bacterium]|nr:zf-HC2 domain-containing protein [Deltaproteobacteria bacterium]
MTCRELIDFLAEYVAGTLDVRERATFETHIADCPACIDYVRSYRETIRVARDTAARDATAAEMPRELTDAILDATRHRRGR